LFSARATRGLEVALLGALVSPLLVEWFQTVSTSSRLSYALLVPVLSGILAWRALRPETARDGENSLEQEKHRSSAATLTVGAALAAALLLLGGTLTGVFTLSLLAIPTAAVALVGRHLGRAGLVRGMPALALAFALVPPPMPLLDRINPLLVEASGRTAAALLTPLDHATSWTAATLEFRGWTLIVAEACSGSGTFLTLGVLGAFLAALFRLRWPAGLGLVLLSFPLTLLVNGTRIASSALVIDRFGAQAGEGLAHELLGQVVVVAGAAALALAVERWSARRASPRGARA